MKNLSDDKNINYILANVSLEKSIEKEIWNGAQFIKIYIIKDSKATPKMAFEGYDGVYESIIISTMPDGDYYSDSKLYKVEGLLIPKILEINETFAPNFSIKIEHGSYDDRKTDIIFIDGVL